MAVSKRLRFEILKRDNHTCRYCGRRPPEVKLHVDHVVPSSLGGSDTPDNLVAACEDCNSGKGSSHASAPVDQPTLDAMRWHRAVEEAAEDRRRYRDREGEVVSAFYDGWPWAEMPDDWQASVAKFGRMGLAAVDASHFLERALQKCNDRDHAWLYFCKVCWSEVRAIRARAAVALAEETRPAPVEPETPEPAVDDYDPPIYREEPVDLSAPPWFDHAAEWHPPLCIECDERRPVAQGMCTRCLRNLMEGLA